MTCGENTAVTIVKGEDRTLNVKLVTPQENGIYDPFDITGVTQIEARFKNADNTVLSKLLTISGVLLVNAASGSISIVLTDTETALLKEGSRLGFHVIVDIGTTRRRINFDKSITVVAPSI